jgi:hypothetical protein
LFWLRPGMKSKPSAHPDLQSQLESLLDQVWRSEADWRLWDRVDAFVMLESLRARRAQRAWPPHHVGRSAPPEALPEGDGDVPSESAA